VLVPNRSPSGCCIRVIWSSCPHTRRLNATVTIDFDVGSETIEVKDYLTMPKTGLLNEKAPNDVFFARVNALKEEPGDRRVSADQPLTVNPF
jgi:hypothetical protein